jgi:Ca-activated chloride channel homolog
MLRTLPVLVLLAAFLLVLLPAAAHAVDKKPKLGRKEKKELIQKLPEKYRTWLAEVDLLIGDDELAAFLALDKDYLRDAFIKRFWEVRDPYKGTPRNEFYDRWQSRLQEVRDSYGSLDDERSRIYLLNGPPTAVLESTCTTLLWPLQVWFYDGSDQLHQEYFVIFYRHWGAGPYQVWQPIEGLDVLFADSGTQRGRADLQQVADFCRDGDRLAGAINWVLQQGMGYSMLEAKFDSKPSPPGGEWLQTFESYSTDLPEGAKLLPARLDLEFPGRHQNRTVMQGVVNVTAGGAGLEKLGDHRSYDFIVNGEVLQNGELFDTFRYKFDLPSNGEAPEATLPLVFQRFLRPGDYSLIVKVEDLNAHKYFRAERPLKVPEVAQAAAPLPLTPEEKESARLLAEANAAISSGETTIKLIPPQGDLQTGMQRFDTLTTGAGIDRVTFALDGKPVLTKKRPPYSVELDLGPLPRTRTLTATVFDATGNQLAVDEMPVNAAGHRFRVKLVEPQKRKAYASSLLARAEVQVPDGEAVERVEFYLNETRVATLYQAPYVQPVVLPKDQPVSYVRAVAYEADGSSTEDLVFVNAPDYPEELNVNFVELYATVLDRQGRPVSNLAQKDFTVFEDGKHQEIARFDRVTNLPIHAVVAIDVSASMESSLEKTRDAALRFLQETIKPKDRAAIVTFNDRPNLAIKFSNDLNTLAGGLAGLKAERGTALYDTVVFALYYFNGIKGQRTILLLSDGKDENSRFTFEDTLDYARRAGVTVYSIGLGNEVDKRKLTKIAEETGGRSFFVQSAAELGPIYAAIQQELRSQYLVAYQSTNTTGENVFRAIELKVDRPGLEVKTLRGYYP